MTSTGLAVVFFLLGVMVGRGASILDIVTGGQAAGAGREETFAADEQPFVARITQREPSMAATDGTELSYFQRLDDDGGPELDSGLMEPPAPPTTAGTGAAHRWRAMRQGGPDPTPDKRAATRSRSRRCARARRPNAWRRGSSRRDIPRSSSRRRRVHRFRCSGFVSGRTRTGSRPSRFCAGSKAKSRSSPGSRGSVPSPVSLLPLAVLSGVLLFLSFPTLGHPAVAWLALVPLLVAVAGATPWQALRLGTVTGLVHFAGTLYWVPAVLVDYGGLPAPAAWLVQALFVAFLALFPALFAAGAAELASCFGARGLLFAPALWVTTELGRMHLFTGFPWALVGYSQVPFPAVAQTASVAGVLGVSALVVLVNGAVAYAVVAGAAVRRTPVVGTVAVVAAAVAFGTWRLQDDSLLRAGTPLRVAALQGDVRQDEKWNPLRSDAILETYLSQTRRAAAAGAGLVVWPESATPFAIERDARGEAVRATARETGAHLLVGTTQVVRDAGTRYYNAAYLIEPGEGATAGVYRKQHLVPFGEYVPLRWALFFASPLVETIADFSAGTEPRTLPVDGRPVGTAICYEIIYPGLVRELVLHGSQLLATVTNDAWYGRSAAPHQHFQQATMRAIEQGRFLVRAANTGVSGVIDPYGRVLAQSRLFEPAVLVDDVRLLEGLTIYGRFGDVPAYAGAALAALALVYGRRRRLRG